MLRYLLTIKTYAGIYKNQYPQITKELIIIFFYNEVKRQHHTTLDKKDNLIEFTIHYLDLSITNFQNKFSNYSKGKFIITENDTYIRVFFEGQIKRGLIRSAILPSILFVIILFFLNEETFLLPIIPILYWIFIFSIQWFIEKISMPLYITDKLNRIKEKLRDEEPIL